MSKNETLNKKPFIKMESRLSSDTLRETALNLSPRDILSLCLTNKRYNSEVCESISFWQRKILKDYPNGDYNEDLFRENPKYVYMLLHTGATTLKDVDKVVMFKIATMLDLDDLLNLCTSDTRFNELICEEKYIWNYKLIREFPDWREHFDGQDVREVYSLLVGLTKLKRDISYSGSIYRLFETKNLYLGGKLHVFPPEIGLLTNLKILDLSNNNLTTLPSKIGLLKNLKILDLSNNSLTSLPSEIGLLSNLKELFLSRNMLTTLPSEIGSLHRLEILHLDRNRIRTLPREIGLLSNLKELLLSENRIEIIPTEIFLLTGLIELSFRDNYIKELPSKIGSLTKLEILYIHNNPIVVLPPEILLLKNLVALYVNMSVQNIPKELSKIVRYM